MHNIVLFGHDKSARNGEIRCAGCTDVDLSGNGHDNARNARRQRGSDEGDFEIACPALPDRADCLGNPATPAVTSRVVANQGKAL